MRPGEPEAARQVAGDEHERRDVPGVEEVVEGVVERGAGEQHPRVADDESALPGDLLEDRAQVRKHALGLLLDPAADRAVARPQSEPAEAFARLADLLVGETVSVEQPVAAAAASAGASSSGSGKRRLFGRKA